MKNCYGLFIRTIGLAHTTTMLGGIRLKLGGSRQQGNKWTGNWIEELDGRAGAVDPGAKAHSKSGRTEFTAQKTGVLRVPKGSSPTAFLGMNRASANLMIACVLDQSLSAGVSCLHYAGAIRTHCQALQHLLVQIPCAHQTQTLTAIFLIRYFTRSKTTGDSKIFPVSRLNPSINRKNKRKILAWKFF